MGPVIAVTLLLLLASTGLLHPRAGSDALVEADGVWAGILAAGSAVAWACLPVASSRPDRGYRHQGLPGLLTVGAIVAMVVNLAVMSLWPFIVGDRADHDDVIATLLSDPVSWASAAAFLLAMRTWNAVSALGFVGAGRTGSAVLALGAVGGFLLLVLGGLLAGAALFDNPPNVPTLGITGVAAILGLGALAASAALLPQGPR